MKILLINRPIEYYDLLEADISDQVIKKSEIPNLIHLFVKTKKEFESAMKKLKPVIKKKTSLTIWVSWYKKSSKIPTDVTEDSIRNYALQNDLVDVKVCAVSDVWSACPTKSFRRGLKLVVPVKKR